LVAVELQCWFVPIKHLPIHPIHPTFFRNFNHFIKTSSLSEMKDKYIGKVGSTERDAYENELRMEILGRTIKISGKNAG
jgi:hypothetical protein